LDYRSTTEFGALAGQLLADLERLRPGLGPNASAETIEKSCGDRLRLRLPEIYAEYQGDSSDAESTQQLQLYQRELTQLLLPRYAALAERQNRIESRSGPGRGTDAYNRLTYAALFFAIGVLVIRLPFIPLWDKWIPFVLALVAPVVSPWLPDLYQMMMRRRHAIALGVLHMDLDQAGRALPLPPLALPASAQESAAAAPPGTSRPRAAETVPKK
jgi:hypothetical protein